MTVITASSVYSLPGDDRLGRALFVRASAWLAILIVVAVYVWIVSAGTWTKWPSYGHGYYQDLADGFRNGQLSVASKPKPELLASKDPYDPVANEGLRIHDVSLYNGKFYLYWGPVPAILPLATNLVGVPKIGDQHLVFFFAVGTLGLSARLIIRLWRRYFLQTVPAWAVPLAILTIGLANPAPFNLARASIYEAAIAAAQMFMVGGLYFVITGLFNGRASRGRLFFAGLMFACAVGSRASMALPVAGIAVLTLWQVIRLGGRQRIVKTRNEAAARRVAPPSDAPGQGADNTGFAFLMPRGDAFWRTEICPPRVVPLVAFLLPLLIGAAALGWYNRARFGSPLELGVRYQLAGFNSFKNIETLTSTRNVVPNVYSYLLRAPILKTVFPYLVPRSGFEAAFPGWLPVPAFHQRDATVAGMLLVTPFVFFSLVALGRRRGMEMGAESGGDAFFFSTRWIAAMLTVTVVLSALPALILSFSTMRYLADWSMPLMLLAVIGYWRGSAARVDRPWSRRLWLATGMALMSITVLSGPLLGVTGALDQFARHNPALLQRLVERTYRGPVPGVAQVSGPAGVERMDKGGWWIGSERAAVDVIAPRNGWYAVELTTSFGPGLQGVQSADLIVQADPTKPLPNKASEIAATLTLAPEQSVVRFITPFRAGLNRLFLSTPAQPIVTTADPLSRRMIGVAHMSIRTTAPATTGPANAMADPTPAARQ